jgi:hypothetical protein
MVVCVRELPQTPKDPRFYYCIRLSDAIYSSSYGDDVTT